MRASGHILFLSHYFPPEVNAPANRTFEHVIRWVKQGWKVTVITNNPNHPHGVLFEGYNNNFCKFESIDGINVIRVKTYLTANKGLGKRIINYVFFMSMAVFASFKVKRFDLVFATSPQFFCGIAGAIIRKIRSKPFVLEIRDLWPDSIIAVGAMRNRPIISFLHFLERWMYFSADSIVTVTRTLRDKIIEKRYPKNRLFVIFNGVDLSLYNQNLKYEDPGFSFKDKFIVAYIGTFGMAHKLETVLKTANLCKKDHPDILFLLVGDGAEREKLLRIKQEMNLWNVLILPLQTRERIPKLLRHVDIGLVVLKNDPLFESAIPSKTFEYMANKIPTIFSVPKGEGTDFIDKYKCGIVIEPENHQKMLEAIEFMFSNPILMAEMGENGRRAIYEKFNRDILALKVLKVLCEVIDNNHH